MTSLPFEAISYVGYNLLVLGVALTLVSVDRESAQSRALASVMFLLGTDNLPWMLNTVLGVSDPPPWVMALHPEAFAGMAVAEWLRREVSAVAGAGTRARVIERLFWFAVVQSVIHEMARVYFSYELFVDFWSPHPSAWALRLNGWNDLWNVCGNIAIAVPTLLLVFGQRNAQESIRLMGVVLALPFYSLTLFVDTPLEEITLRYLAILILAGSMMRYHRAQGARGQFLSRFLSPQVGALVHERGLQQALHQAQQEITAVYCDLRGFAAYAQAQASDKVAGVLTDYYNAVSEAAARSGATVKDFAGDGALILVGAPLPVTDSAARGLALAHAISESVRRVLARGSEPQRPLSVGVGVATGRVTVGVIDAASRLEYAAVGPAVNLAARLCARARDGEILVDGRTAELSGSTLEQRGSLSLKGLGDVAHYAAVPVPQGAAT